MVAFGCEPMPCFHPIPAFQRVLPDASGVRPVVFSRAKCSDDSPWRSLTLPCGGCDGCLLSYSRQWAIRCMHEASLYERNCMVTLTYADEAMPSGCSLSKRDFQDFMKRLRRSIEPERVRYFHCGEYGESFGRPHYHALLFGYTFPDRVVWTNRGGFTVWRSAKLEQLWPYGHSEVGSVTFDSAAYVARYIFKKVRGPVAERHYRALDAETGEVVDREPEYTTMSRRPGVGADWLKVYGAEVYRGGSVIVGGYEVPPPRFYDSKYEVSFPEEVAAAKRERQAKRNPAEETPERLYVREQVCKAKLNLKRRSI